VYTKEYTDDQFILSDPCAHLINLCFVYVIAEAMLDVQTRNVIVRALYEFTINLHDKGYYYPNVRCIDIIYNGTASSSNPMRRLIVDMWFDNATASWFSKDHSDMSSDFLGKLVLKRISLSKVSEPVKYDIEVYMEVEGGDDGE
jgi:hypothetical protein